MNNFENYLKTLKRIWSKKKALKNLFKGKKFRNEFFYTKNFIYNKLFVKYLFCGLLKRNVVIHLKPETIGTIQRPFSPKLEVFLLKIIVKLSKKVSIINSTTDDNDINKSVVSKTNLFLSNLNKKLINFQKTVLMEIVFVFQDINNLFPKTKINIPFAYEGLFISTVESFGFKILDEDLNSEKTKYILQLY